MAAKWFMPRQIAGQVAFAGKFVAAVTANGGASAYGLTPALFASFESLNADLQAAWTASEGELTRTKVTIDQRDQLLARMKKLAGQLASIVQGTPTVTSDMLLAAGLTVRSDVKTKPAIPDQPYVVATAVDGRNVTVDVMQGRSKRGKPARVSTITLLTATGPTAPMTIDGYTYAMATGRTTTTIPFPPSTTGDTVWITAFYSNTMKETGPIAAPLKVNLAAGGSNVTEAATERTRMRVAA